MKVLVDTNVIIDLLARREEFYQESAEIFSLADNKKIELVVSTLSMVNTHYILSEVMKIKKARSIIGKFKVLVCSYELSDKIIELALNDLSFKDFEDAIQHYTALESKCNLIITRNKRDFKNSTLPVMNPKQFIAKRKSER